MILEEEAVVPIAAPEEWEVVESGEEEQEQWHPHQLTLFYQNALLCFEEAFQQGVNKHKNVKKLFLNSNNISIMMLPW
jgi:hypothetical protein